jgi:hypothetical protein
MRDDTLRLNLSIADAALLKFTSSWSRVLPFRTSEAQTRYRRSRQQQQQQQLASCADLPRPS